MLDGEVYDKTRRLPSGYSVSLSSLGDIIAIGGPGDKNGIGAAWIFVYAGSGYQQLGTKLVATDSTGPSQQGRRGATYMSW